MTDDTGAPNVKLPDGRLRVSEVQLLLLLRVLEDTLRTNKDFIEAFSYTYDFRKELYDDIMAQQDQEVC